MVLSLVLRCLDRFILGLGRSALSLLSLGLFLVVLGGLGLLWLLALWLLGLLLDLLGVWVKL